MTQESFWDARAARDDALERVSRPTPEWRAIAYLFLESLASRRPRLTSEMLWAYLLSRGVPMPPEPRAMGPVMLKAVRDGMLRPLDYVPGRRVSAHGRPVREYESLIFKEDE